MKATRPLNQYIDSPTDEARVSRMWTQINARRADATRRPLAGERSYLRPRVMLAAAAALLLTGGAAGWYAFGLADSATPTAEAPNPSVENGASSGGDEGGSHVDHRAHENRSHENLALTQADHLTPAGNNASAGSISPLRTRGGDLPEVLATGDQSRRRIDFDDGSQVRIEPGSRLETMQNEQGRFVTLLSRGRARFSVQPGGPRRWVVESGLATVEVIGTVFTVDRQDQGVRVSVERGVVLVSGERVPDRLRRVTAGQSLFVAADAASTTAPAPTRAPANHGPAAASSSALQPEATPAGSSSEPSASAPPMSAAEHLDRYTEAMRRGQRAEGLRHLRAALALHRQDPANAALAAFSLGRLERRPDAAQTHFERALRLGLPPHLASQARERIRAIETHSSR